MIAIVCRAVPTALLCSLGCACTSTPPTASAAIAQQLGIAPSSELVGTWVDAKTELDLAATGDFVLRELSAQPPTSSTGSWGVAEQELDLIFDAADAGPSRRTAWTYAADGGHLGTAVLADGGNVGAIGTWTGQLLDEQVDATGRATSGTAVTTQISLGADGTVAWHAVTTPTPGAPTSDDEAGTYVAAGDGTLTLALRADAGIDEQQLVPLAGGYASVIMTRP